MLQLAVSCLCGRRPPRRLFAWERDRWTKEHPELPIETNQCDRCGRWFPVLAKHYQLAISAGRLHQMPAPGRLVRQRPA